MVDDGKNSSSSGATAAVEQDFVSKQVRSLETGRDKKENHLISKFARAQGAASVRWEGKTGRKRPETRCFARMVGLLVCM